MNIRHANHGRASLRPISRSSTRFSSKRIVDRQMFCHGPPLFQGTADYGGMRTFGIVGWYQTSLYRLQVRVQTGVTAVAIGVDLAGLASAEGGSVKGVVGYGSGVPSPAD